MINRQRFYGNCTWIYGGKCAAEFGGLMLLFSKIASLIAVRMFI